MASISIARAAVGEGVKGVGVGVVWGWQGFSHSHSKPSSVASVLGDVSGVRDAIRLARQLQHIK